MGFVIAPMMLLALSLAISWTISCAEHDDIGRERQEPARFEVVYPVFEGDASRARPVRLFVQVGVDGDVGSDLVDERLHARGGRRVFLEHGFSAPAERVHKKVFEIFLAREGRVYPLLRRVYVEDSFALDGRVPLAAEPVHELDARLGVGESIIADVAARVLAENEGAIVEVIEHSGEPPGYVFADGFDDDVGQMVHGACSVHHELPFAVDEDLCDGGVCEKAVQVDGDPGRDGGDAPAVEGVPVEYETVVVGVDSPVHFGEVCPYGDVLAAEHAAVGSGDANLEQDDIDIERPNFVTAQRQNYGTTQLLKRSVIPKIRNFSIHGKPL